MAQSKSLLERIHIFEDKFGGLALYCRLRELDVPKEYALELSKRYENLVYFPAIELAKMKEKEK